MYYARARRVRCAMPNWTLHPGDCLDVLKTLPANSVDAVVTDPPYGLSNHDAVDVAYALRCWLDGKPYTPKGKGFMGRQWDAFVPGPEVWRECLRVLKPGGHLLVFAGTRTQDLMGIAVRLAGFDARDSLIVQGMLHWQYASGAMVKSLDVSKALSKVEGAAKAWEGWGTSLRPSQEPILVFRKPLIGNVADNVLAHGTGALNIDGCRNPLMKSEDPRQLTERSGGRRGFQDQYVGGQVKEGLPPGWDCSKGRWPTNTLLCHTPDCRQDDTAAWDCADGCPVKALDEQSGSLHLAGTRTGTVSKGIFHGGDASTVYGDTGGASRFYPQFTYGEGDDPFLYMAKASPRDRSEGLAGDNTHPTVKPISLMRWLTRLVTPPSGTVLDPFNGSGTTGCAAVLEGFHYIGIEREPEYVEIARARIAHHLRASQGGVASPWTERPVVKLDEPETTTLTLDDLFGL